MDVSLIKGRLPARIFRVSFRRSLLDPALKTLILQNNHSFAMHMPPHFPFLGLALLCSSALAATIPQSTALTTPTNPATNRTLNATSNAAFVCNKQTPGRVAEPLFGDCAGALLSLPLNPAIGYFYNTGQGDFQLPVFERYKSCEVLVEMRSRYDKLRSSWLAVHVAATELNVACLSNEAIMPSAYTYLDELQTVKISLRGVQRGLGDGTNGTGATATS